MDRLTGILRSFNIDCVDEKAEVLREYMELVLDRNQHVNLTAIADRDEFIERHYVDSLVVAGLPEWKGARSVIDLGTGGGFPGIPLAVAFPEKEFMLVDSLNKRIRIIQEFCEDLGIRNVDAIHGRAEELGQNREHREHFDVCVSRAVADMRVLAEYCLPFVKTGGWFIAYKGADCDEEVKNAEHALTKLGGRIDRIIPASDMLPQQDENPTTSEHKLVLIHKTEPTPKAYPRRAGTPSKKPL